MNKAGEETELGTGGGQPDPLQQKDERQVDAGAARNGSKETPHVVLPREAQGRIGQHLRRVYGEILSEPLPDKFSQLLESLAKTERSE